MAHDHAHSRPVRNTVPTVTLRPVTRVRVDGYNFTVDKPAEDNIALRLLRGGFRTVTGLVGKRGSQDAYRIHTTTATKIGRAHV